MATTTKTNFLTELEDWFENGLRKLENKMPSAVSDAAIKAAGYLGTAVKFLESGTCATVIETLIPAAEPAREELIGIATSLQADFKAVSAASQPILITGAGAMATNAIHAAANSGTTLSLPAATNAYVLALAA